MSIVLPVLYHWSPSSRRAGIRRRGLTPHTLAAVFVEIDREYTTISGDGGYHCMTTVEAREVRSVALGTSPSHAWSLSGMVSAGPGEEWDLWQVTLDETDEVSQREFTGYRLNEFRVLNRIPRERCWLVGTRTCNSRRPY